MTNPPIDPESTPTFHPDPEDVLECARSIRPELEELLGPKAEQVDCQLADLLAQANTGQQVDGQIIELLGRDEETYYWMAEFFSEPPESKGFQRLPGPRPVGQVHKYVCRVNNDYTWYRRGCEEIRTCPTCGEKLEPAD
jgi:hypothetical protein